MAPNLANVYAYLKRSHTVSYIPPVSYLKSIIGENAGNSKIIFVFKETKVKKESNFISPSKLEIKQDPNLDVTGSPLKDNCVVEDIDILGDMKLTSSLPWTYEEECHKGLTIEKARLILCDSELQSMQSQGSVWVLCDGSDVDKTLFLERDFSENSFIRGIVSFNGICSPSNVNLKDLFRRHFQVMRQSSKVDTTIECHYNIKSNICLKSSWSTASMNPTLNNFKNSDITLYQTFTINDSNCEMEDLMVQIKRLMDIKQDIIDYRENRGNSKEPIYHCSVGLSLHHIKENIMNAMSEISGFNDVESYNDSDCDIEAVVQRAKNRLPVDLTDKLWDIIRFSSSYDDLKLACNYVFQCAAKCNIVNTPTNNNRLAEIIREITNRRLAIPCLSGSEPLELILEIGIEKLFKDYEFIFTECKICGSNDLRRTLSIQIEEESELINAPINLRKSLSGAARSESVSSTLRSTLLHNTKNTNSKSAVSVSRQTLLHSNINTNLKLEETEAIGFQNSRFDRKDVEFHLAKLLQIHLVLEHLMMMNIHLNLSNAYGYISEQLLKKPLPIAKTVDESLMDKIEIPMMVDYVRHRLENSEPNVRRITLKSRNKFREVQNTYYFSTENICPPNVWECPTNDKEMLKDNMYYCWQYTKITGFN